MIDFGEFFRAVQVGDSDPALGDHQEAHAPYPWQRRLAERCAHDHPPAVIAVPTGTGKTMTIDALVWALAHQAERPAAERTVGVRIVWAIDRRIIVDEVHEHARALAETLTRALEDRSDALHDVASRLARLSGG
ncbi:MAG: DEAD/DEAH box helicase family protein, partial [Pseudonocardiaceae bacterium]